jgi:TonB family protein
MRKFGTLNIAVHVCFALVFALGIARASLAQTARIAHFVAPSYPPLARQTMVSGQVTLVANIGKDGSVANTSPSSSANQMLLQEAQATVSEWKFEPSTAERMVTVVFYFGFSGATRETNPKTSIKADFSESSVRVFITTDGVPAEHP